MIKRKERRVYLYPFSIGRNIAFLIDRSDEPHVFRFHKDRVYYMRYLRLDFLYLILTVILSSYSEAIAKRASNISRENLASLGLCFGKFTKTGKFTLHVTSLDYLAQYAKYKIWLKNTAEMSYMYGNHVLKAHINKMIEDTPEHQGVIIYSASDLPLVNYFDYFEICESDYICF